MKRRSRTRRVLLHVSLLVCLMSLILLIVSTYRAMLWINQSGTFSTLIENGSFTANRIRGPWTHAFPYHAGWSSYTPPDMDSWRWLPYYNSDELWGATLTQLSIPLWMPLVLSAVPPVAWLVRRRPWPDGRCQNCGYNLTGNVSGRCPECGTDVPAKHAT